jgi:peptidoglycan hydrolase CwlO-like protein
LRNPEKESKTNNSIYEIKIPIKSLADRVEQVQNKVSGTESKVEELDQNVKEYENMNGTCKTSGTP